ncbi:MAG: hypothetical protein ACI9D5_002810, partial [Candidatus Endobugula sp.]
MKRTLFMAPEQASIAKERDDVRRAHSGMLLWALIVG